MTAALALTNATARQGGRVVLESASLSVSAGEVVGVVGANGAGKTTLLRSALGLLKLETGRAELSGQDVSTLSDPERARHVAYLPQERKVGWNMSAWRVASLGAVTSSPAEARRRAQAALIRVGLAGLEDRGVLEMSGGERARVLLARLLVAEAPLLVADEPVAGLDPDAQLLTLEILRDAAANGSAVVLTLHDLGLAARFCDRLVVLSRGKVVADAEPADALTPCILADAFALDGGLEIGRHGPTLAAQRLPRGPP